MTHQGRALTGVAGVLAAAVIGLAAAGCGGGMTARQGRAAAAKARGQVLPAVRVLYQRIYGARVGWSYTISANFLPCVSANSTTEVAYHNYLSYVIAFKGISPASFGQRILSIVHASGWKTTRNNRAMPSGQWDVHYDMAKGPVTGDMALAGDIALLRFSSPCFDAGPAAASLGSRGGYDIPLPHPSLTASPSPASS